MGWAASHEYEWPGVSTSGTTRTPWARAYCTRASTSAAVYTSWTSNAPRLPWLAAVAGGSAVAVVTGPTAKGKLWPSVKCRCRKLSFTRAMARTWAISVRRGRKCLAQSSMRAR